MKIRRSAPSSTAPSSTAPSAETGRASTVTSLRRKVVCTVGTISVAMGVATVGLLSAAGTASAQQYQNTSTLVAASSWLDVAVSGGSTSAGAPIIQWWADGGAEQQWTLPLDNSTDVITNKNSRMCITTDETAGDQLFQEPCTGAPSQRWTAAYTYLGPTTYINPASGLVMDVSGYSLWGGGAIDAWYPNNQANQAFWSATTYLG